MSEEFGMTVAEQNKFRDDFIAMCQQMDTRLRPTVRDEPDYINGNYGYFDRIGSTKSRKRTGKYTDTPIIPTKFSRRRVWRDTYDWSDLIERAEVRRIVKNPQNAIVTNAYYAWARDVDTAIIEAALGTAEAAADEQNKSWSPVALPDSQKIAVGTTGLTVAKLRQAKKILDKAEVPEGEPRHIIVTAEQVDDMLGTTEVTSADYAAVKALVKGDIDTFVGFKFVRTELLPLVGSTRSCLAYLPRAIGLAADLTPFFRAKEDPGKNYNVRPYMEWEIGAVRVQDEALVQIDCKEPA